MKKSILLAGIACFWGLLAAAQETAVQPKGLYNSDFVISGIPRNIIFYIPLNYGKNDTYPLVFFLHGEGETGKTIIKKYGDLIQQLADSSGCIVVYPDAVKGHWNTKMGDHAQSDSINDVGFLHIMMDYFSQQYKGDADRVFVAGFYSGGEMAWRSTCDMPKKIAAIAPFISSVQIAAKLCTPAVYFNADKFMVPPGRKFSNEALTAAWNFLLAGDKK